MKKITLTILSLAIVAIFTGFTNPDATFSVDTEASQLKWTGYHLAKSYEHTGFIKLKSGKIATNKGIITSGEFVIDMNSLTDADLTDAEKNGKLVGHLKSADFFDVANNPEAKLVITKSVASGNGMLKTTGDLTIRGITKSIQFDTKLTENGNQVEYEIKVKGEKIEMEWEVVEGYEGDTEQGDFLSYINKTIKNEGANVENITINIIT